MVRPLCVCGPVQVTRIFSGRCPIWLCRLWCSVSETRGNGGAFRDRSSRPWALSFGHPWPNRSLQAPPLPRSLGSGTATGPKRRPDLSTKPWRRISQGAPGSGGRSGEKSLWHPAGSFAPFRGRGPLSQFRLRSRAAQLAPEGGSVSVPGVQDCVRQGAEHKPPGTDSRRVLGPRAPRPNWATEPLHEPAPGSGAGRGGLGLAQAAPLAPDQEGGEQGQVGEQELAEGGQQRRRREHHHR